MKNWALMRPRLDRGIKLLLLMTNFKEAEKCFGHSTEIGSKLANALAGTPHKFESYFNSLATITIPKFNLIEIRPSDILKIIDGFPKRNQQAINYP